MDRADLEWVELAVAPDQIVAEMWQEYFGDHQIPVMLEPGDAVSFMGISSMPVRVHVPAEVEDEARRLLEEFEDTSIDPEALAAEAEAATPEADEPDLVADVVEDVAPDEAEPTTR